MPEESHDQHSEKHAGGHKPHGGGGHHGGGGSHEEHEGAPEWLISFADNTALMMGFFVIMLALAMKPSSGAADTEGGADGPSSAATAVGASPAELEWTLGVREGFNNPVNINSTDPRDALLVAYLKKKNAGHSDSLSDGLRGREHDVESVRRTGIFGAGGAVRFDLGSSTLDEGALAAVTKLASQFRGMQTRLEIRGHCSAAESYEEEDRGMALAYSRALAVARALAEGGIDWRRLRISSSGDSERIAEPAYDLKTHALNQRVEVFEINGSSSPITP